MNSKVIATVIVAVLVVAGAGAAIVVVNNDRQSGPSDLIMDYRPDTAGQTFTDGAGREVTVPDQLGHGIVTIGSSGPLRFLSVFGLNDLVIETDKGDVTDNRNGRAYSYAYPFSSLERYHADNTISSALVEDLGQLKPSLVIIQNNIYTSNKELCDNLAKVTTVVVIEAQQMQYMLDDDGKVASYLVNNFTMLGKVLGKDARAAEIIDGIQGIVDDIESLSSGTSDKKVYVAGVTISGSNPLNTTFPIYIPFDLTGVNNAYTGSTDNKVSLTVEEFTVMDIDMIVIDPSSVDKIVGNTGSQYVLEYLYGINNDGNPDNDIPLYVTVPIVWDSINYDCAMASAYYIAHLVYGTLTLEEVEQKVVNIFTTFYGDGGKDVLKDMQEFFSIKSSGSGQKVPMFSELTIVKSGDNYLLTTA
ncbi:MAG: ABC transporter substrate-binding protein [Candidatus Methanomethylophilaceae archaeon]